MAELLALKTDDLPGWRNANPRVMRDLRAGETKSTWAYVLDDSASHEDILASEPPRASRHFQALALFVFCHKNPNTRRTRVQVVAIQRDALPAELVTDDSFPHLVARFSETHRSLRTDSDNVRELILERCFGGACSTKTYTKAELLPLLRELMDDGHVDPAWRDIAARVLEP